ncbi:MAG: spermidine/putrescine ABC transporter substrate-binding protein [Chloroflexota bacterium]
MKPHAAPGGTRTRILLALILSLFVACTAPTPIPTPSPTTGTTQLVMRNWEGDISQSILDVFEDQTGIRVLYKPYESQEATIDEIRSGEIYDVVVLENQLIPALVADGMLAEIDYTNVPNFKNLSANFRDLAYDPRNAHSVPYSWGTTGLVVRTDLTPEPVTRWADLWNPEYAGKVMAWTLSRYVIGATLKSLGYSLNSEDPEELEAARQKLLELRPNVTLVDWESAVSAPFLASGEIYIAMGQADDVIEGKKQNPAIEYILPQEGGILWGDNFTIPANSPNKAAAEKLINYLLSAEVAAQIINDTFYWLPNDAALPLVDPEIRENPAIFPSSGVLANAEILLPINPEAETLYSSIWESFLSASQ